MKVLIVDDKEKVLESLSRSLRSFSDKFEIYTARNSEEAINLCKNNRFDRCLIDYKLKDEDGITLAFNIKKILPDAKLAILSAFSEPECYQHKPYEAWIIKSFDLQPLIDFLTSNINYVF